VPPCVWGECDFHVNWLHVSRIRPTHWRLNHDFDINQQRCRLTRNIRVCMCVCVCVQVYRNAECARCNRVSSADCYDERTPKIDVDDLRRELFGPALSSSSLVLVIDLNSGTAEVHRSVPRRLPGDVEPTPPVAAVPLASCRPGEVYDPYDDSCRPVGCSWDGSAAFGSSSVCPSTTITEYL